jgi:hypothetical protein
MLTRYQFNRLADPKKKELLQNEASFIGHFSLEEGEGMKLFALGPFFVEVWISSGKIVKFKTFQSNRSLSKYLHFIDISDIGKT